MERSFVEMAERRGSPRLRSGRGWVGIVAILEMVYEREVEGSLLCRFSSDPSL